MSKRKFDPEILGLEGYHEKVEEEISRILRGIEKELFEPKKIFPGPFSPLSLDKDHDSVVEE